MSIDICPKYRTIITGLDYVHIPNLKTLFLPLKQSRLKAFVMQEKDNTLRSTVASLYKIREGRNPNKHTS